MWSFDDDKAKLSLDLLFLLFVNANNLRRVIEDQIHGLVPAFEFAVDLAASIELDYELLILMMRKLDEWVFGDADVKAQRCHYLNSRRKVIVENASKLL